MRKRKLPITIVKQCITGRVICWACGAQDKTLNRIRDASGKKTQDYVCIDCRVQKGIYTPPVANISIMKFAKAQA